MDDQSGQTDSPINNSDLPVNADDHEVPADFDLWRFEHTFRVNYYETDGQRRVHHSNYLNYFERGRVEMLRAAGISYKSLEDAGSMLVVSEMNVRYLAAAEFDDVLTLRVNVLDVRKVRIRHSYQILRGEELVVEAESTIACVNHEGKPNKLPAVFLEQWKAR
ncbi:acyl-CoA thioesterase [Rubripirellula amarantea]|uniref:acyl-CoA thioesterase n=1 Tax=Rubripirellula amarantea TaxID=2527999 RepID=UPI0028F41703|nr:thioesterase family protein [Rubripirellula amarantea]